MDSIVKREVQKALMLSNFKIGEEILCETLENFGVDQTKEALKEASPIQLANFVNKTDYTKASVLHQILDPDMFLSILKKDPLLWEIDSESDLGNVVRDIQSLLLAILHDLSIDERGNFIELIAKDDIGFKYLIIPFLEEGLELEDIEASETVDNTPQQLYSLIWEATSDVAKRIIKEKDNVDENLVVDTIIGIVRDSHAESSTKKKGTKTNGKRKYEEAFEPL